MKLEGIIQKDGVVRGEDGKKYYLPVRGTDKEGYPEVLINAREVGGKDLFHKQSIKNYVGMRVKFLISPTGEGYNYKIIKKGVKK